MATTTNLSVTKIDSAQAQKEVTANEAFDVFDAALSGISIALSDANYTLSLITVPQEWQYGVIRFTGTLTAGRNIIVPNNLKQYVIINATSGGFALTVKTSGGTGIAVSASTTAQLYCDGTNVVAVTPGTGAGTVTSVGVSSTDLSVSGSPVTTSGNITLNINNDAVTYAKIQNVSATDKILGRSTAGAGDVEEITCTAAGRALIDDADAAAQRTTLGLGSAAVLSSIPAIIQVAASDETTTLTAGTAKLTFRMPHAMTLTEVRASLTTVSSSGVVTVDINEGGSTILSTKLTIDASELTSTTAATAAVISDSSLADDAEITIDIDGAGTGAKGLKVTLIGTRSV